MTLTAEILTPHLGADVHVQLDDGQHFVLTLDKVTPTGTGTDHGNGGVQHSMFILDLSGPLDPVIESLTYPITFPGQDPVHLFIAANGQDAQGTFYSIVIS